MGDWVGGVIARAGGEKVGLWMVCLVRPSRPYCVLRETEMLTLVEVSIDRQFSEQAATVGTFVRRIWEVTGLFWHMSLFLEDVKMQY
jgi:hypothetical protein